jgi:hypothetical protein
MPHEWPCGHSATPAAAIDRSPPHGRCGNAASRICSDEIPDCFRNADVYDGTCVSAPCATCVFGPQRCLRPFLHAESLQRLRPSGVASFVVVRYRMTRHSLKSAKNHPLLDAIARRGWTERARPRRFCGRVAIFPGSVTRTAPGDLLLHELGVQATIEDLR